MNKLDEINNPIISRQPTELIRIILHGDCKFKDNINNKSVLIATFQFIKHSNRLDQLLI